MAHNQNSVIVKRGAVVCGAKKIISSGRIQPAVVKTHG